MASESVNALKPLQLVITPNLQLMKTFNLSVVVVIKWYHLLMQINNANVLKPKGMLYNAVLLTRPYTMIESN